METPTVVHLKRKEGVEVVSCDVYIGRAMYQGGWKLPCSKWANPYRIQPGTDRQSVLDMYRLYVTNKPELMEALRAGELRGKRLGCWCVGSRCLTCHQPRALCGHLQCHGEILVELLNAQNALAVAPMAVAAIPDNDPLWEELGL